MSEGENQESVIFIGRKSTISYVLVAVTILNKNDTCNIQARGRQISKAVDVAEIVRNRFLPEVRVKEIKIGTEELPTADGRTANTSTIEIILEKP